jgi:putative membrane protein
MNTRTPPSPPLSSAELNTKLALERTLMAADRSLMAWVRTALSMISFGFTIYKILEGFEQQGATLRRINTPRDIGLFLTGLGTVAIVMGTLEYWYRLRGLRREGTLKVFQPSFIMALIMSVAGLFMFIGIVLRAL